MGYKLGDGGVTSCDVIVLFWGQFRVSVCSVFFSLSCAAALIGADYWHLILVC